MTDLEPSDPTSPAEQSLDPTTKTPTPRWASFMALGDSFTEGLEDLTTSGYRGWADQLATILTTRRIAAGLEPITYANLAIRGRTLRPILREQLPVALKAKPDLVSLVGGGNDILRPSVDVDEMARNLDVAVERLRSMGADVLLGTGFDPVGSPVVRQTRGRVATYTAHLWTIARRHGAHVMDLWGAEFGRDWQMWASDRIHLTADGHRRVAQCALASLGEPVDDPNWETLEHPTKAGETPETYVPTSRWVTEHVIPWATRRLRRRSSGDERRAKRPVLTPLWPDDGAIE